MHRPTIGLIAIVLLAVGLLTQNQPDTTVSSACLRIAVLMGIWWFAFPQMRNLPGWLVAVGTAALLIVLWRPKLIVLALPVVAILWFLRPRARRGAGQPR